MTTNRPLCPMIALLSLSVLTTACFDSDEILDDELAATEGSEDDTDTGGTEEPNPDSGEDGTEEPDIGVELAIDGSDQPSPLYSATRLALTAEVDGAQIDRVDFFRNDELIASDDEAPFEAEAIVENIGDEGLAEVLTFTAIAHDAEGHEGLDSVSLPVLLPNPGTIEWDLLGPQVGERWLDISLGADDAVFLTSQEALHRVREPGELVEIYDFGLSVDAATESQDGGVIALGKTDSTTLMYRRFNAQPVLRVLGGEDRVVLELGGDEGQAARVAGLEAGAGGGLLGGVAPAQLAVDADEVAQHAGALGDREAVVADPPVEQLPDPAARVGVGRGSDVRRAARRRSSGCGSGGTKTGAR